MRKEQHSRKAERNGKGRGRMPQEGPKKRKYRKNTVAGSRKGSKWPEEVKTAALADLLVGNNLCAVARRHGVPESTLRSWLAAARKKEPGQIQSLFDDARRDALRALNHNAAAGARVSVEYIRRRLESSQRDAEIYESAVARLDEADGVREGGEAPALPLDPEEQERIMTREGYLFLDEGSMFGPEGDGFERINLACPKPVLMDALKRFEKLYQKYVKESS